MSAKRKKRAPKSGAVWRMSADEATLAKKPRYNGYACGHGAHGDAKYSRTKSKRAWQKQLKQEGAPRGAFIRAAESNGLMSPKEATPHPKRPLSAKDGTRFAQNMKKACRTRLRMRQKAPRTTRKRELAYS